MSEYVIKKALLEFIKARKAIFAGSYKEIEHGAYLELDTIEAYLESGTFNADESEPDDYESMVLLDAHDQIQRLREALEQFGWRLERTSCACGGEWAWLRRRESGAWEMYGCACHHLPATEQAERVKGITEVYVVRNRNKDILYVGLDWNEVEELLAQDASYEYLSYGINTPEKVGTDEWRHNYFGAEWPKVEGDGNDA